MPCPTAEPGWSAWSPCWSSRSRPVCAWRALGCSHSSGVAGRSSSSSSSARPTIRPAPARLLVDPAGLVADATAAIDWYHPSPAVPSSPTACPRAVTSAASLRVIDVATGRHHTDEIPDTRAASVAWLPGEDTFLYARYPEGDQYNRKIYRHQLGPAVGRGRARLGRPADAGDVGRRRGVAGRPATCWSRALVGWSRTDLHLQDTRHRRMAHPDRAASRRRRRPGFDGERLLGRHRRSTPPAGGSSPSRSTRPRAGWLGRRSCRRAMASCSTPSRSPTACSSCARTAPMARVDPPRPRRPARSGDDRAAGAVLGGGHRRHARRTAGLPPDRGLHPPGQPLPVGRRDRPRAARGATER